MKLLGDPLTPCLVGKKIAKEAIECTKTINFIRSSFIFKKIKSDRITDFKGSYYSLIGYWTITPNYYHWMMDVLPMTQLMDNPSCKILIRTPRRNYERESLQELGLWNRCVFYDGDHAEIEDFHFVSHPSRSLSFNPYSVRYLRERFNYLLRPDGEPVKLFVSRKGSLREAYNEAEVEEIFWRNGWQVVDGAKLSFQEQVDLFSRATDICGVHGAGLTNTLWCKKGTRVTEFLADNWLVHSNENIILINELDYQPIILPGGWGGRVSVPIDTVNKIIAES